MSDLKRWAKMKFHALVFILLASPFLYSAEPVEPTIPNLGNKYEIIGYLTTSKKAFHGLVDISLKENSADKYSVTREIDGKKTEGIGYVATSDTEKIQIFIVEFKEEGSSIQIRYMYSSDFDNNLRLTGKIIRTEKGIISNAGIEALFPIKK